MKPISRSKLKLLPALGRPKQCYLCGAALTIREATVDHIVPRGYGGAVEGRNRAWCCERCNTVKSSIPLWELLPHLRRIIEHQAESTDLVRPGECLLALPARCE
jgi:5-methylcytosine-specific restriction endonuclease McrA